MSLRKTGTCEDCGKTLYGDEYGAAGHRCARPTSAAELVEKAELKAWISARDLQDFKDYQDEARNSSFSISTFKTLNDDVEITISIVESEVGK